MMSMTALAAAALTLFGPVEASHATTNGGVLTFIYMPPNTTFSDIFNPFSPGNPLAGMMEVYEPLFWYNQYTGQNIPKLAVSYSYANGHKSIVVKLRHGVKWSDGQPFTAADVAFTLDMITSHPAIDTNGLGSLIQSVKVDGPYQVTVNLKSADSTAWYYIGEQTPMLPKHIWDKVNPLTFKDGNPVTTGPFVFKSVNSAMITFVRNPDYWNPGQPHVAEIQIPYGSDNNVAALIMAQGKFSAGVQFVPSIQTVLLDRSPHYHDWFPPTGAVVLDTNDAVYPLSLVPFRQALSYAIDRQRVSQSGEFGYEPPGNLMALPPNGADKPFIDPALLKQYPATYNPQKARAILKSAGFTWNESGTLIDPHGKPVSLSILVATGITDWIADAGIIASELQSLGINAQVKTPSGSTESGMIANGNFQLAMNWIGFGNPGYFEYNQTLNSLFSAPVGKVASSNVERWNNKATDALLNAYPKAFTFAQQRSIMYKPESIFVQDLPVIPLLNGAAWEQYNDTNLVGWPSAQNPWAMMAGPIDQMYVFAQVRER